MITLASLVETVKKYALNPSETAEDFLNAFLEPYVSAGKIKNRNGEPLILDKSRVSKILTGKDDVPRALRRGLSRLGIEQATANNYKEFLQDHIDPSSYSALKKDVLSLSSKDNPEYRTLLERKGNTCALLASALVVAIKNDNTSRDKHEVWRRGPNSLSLLRGDLLRFGFRNRSKVKNIVVIPTNSVFSTHVTRKFESEEAPLVSDVTLHGQWITRMVESGSKEGMLDVRIRNSLKRQGILPGTSGTYAIGSIAEIETENAVYYLLAISDFDANNNAHSTKESIRRSTSMLVEHYDRRGQGKPIYLPLIGTGMSRANLDPKESLDMLVEAFVGNGLFTGTATIVITPTSAQQLGWEN